MDGMQLDTHDHAGPSTPSKAQPRTHVQPSSASIAHALTSPDRSKAKQLADSLARLACWDRLVRYHQNICEDLGTGSCHSLIDVSALVLHLRNGAAALLGVLPGLAPVLSPHANASDSSSPLSAHSEGALRSALVAAYDSLGDQLRKLDLNSSLAYLLMKLPRHLATPSADPDVRHTNRDLAIEFGRHYRGDAPQRFLSFVTNLNRHYSSLPAQASQPYYRGTPIVQSSGTGKTRMVLELRNHAPLLYVCLRHRDAKRNAKAGYPFPDEGVFDYFHLMSTSYTLQLSCFLAAWFDTLANHLASQEQGPDDGDDDDTLTESLPRAAIAELKFTHLWQLNKLDDPRGNPHREAFFETVSKSARARLTEAQGRYAQTILRISQDAQQQPPSPPPQQQQHAHDAAHPSRETTEPSRETQLHKLHETMMHEQLAAPLAALTTQLHDVMLHLRSRQPHLDEPPVFVAFDECVLLNTARDMHGETQLDCLRRAWNYIGQLCAAPGSLHLWLILMSTSSSAAHLTEYAGAGPSLRRISSAPLPTFVALQSDVLASHDQVSLECAAQVSSSKHILKYGRPLWSSLAHMSEFWNTACFKLLGSNVFQPTLMMHCYSVLASRLALGLVPAQSGAFAAFDEQKINVECAVDRHMRIVTKVSQDGRMHVVSPSEPVLAITAALIMQPDDELCIEVERQRRAPLHTTYAHLLAEFHTRCLLGQTLPLFKGAYGELVARLVLLAAWDAAKRDRIVAEWTAHRIQQPKFAFQIKQSAELHATPEPLEAFVAGLAKLDETDAAQLRQRVEQLKTAAGGGGAWVNFSHFDVLPVPVAHITTEYLWFCWKRGVALQMAHNQRGIDGIIPVFVGHLDRRFADKHEGAGSMTYIAWEAKHRIEPQPFVGDPSLSSKLAGPPLQHAHQTTPTLTERGLLTVLMDLGASQTFAATQSRRPKVERLPTDSLRLNVRGLADAECYPCLDRLGVRDVLANMLGTTMQQVQRSSCNKFVNPIYNQHQHPESHPPIITEDEDEVHMQIG